MSGVRVDEEPRNARPSVIPSASEGPRLHSWITEANLRNQYRTREVPRSEPDWRCLRGSG